MASREIELMLENLAALQKELMRLAQAENGEVPEDPMLVYIRTKTRPVTKELKWHTFSFKQDGSTLFLNMTHTDKRCPERQFTAWVKGWPIDLTATEDEIDATINKAAEFAKRLDANVDALVSRIKQCPNVFGIYQAGND